MTKFHRSFLLLLIPLFAGNAPVFSQASPFASPGLSIGAYHYNFYDGISNTSYLFRGDTVLCGTSLLAFERTDGYTIYLRIDGGKVFYRYNGDLCNDAALWYNFDLNVGQTFQSPSGPLLQVIETGQKTLLNGQSRRYLKLKEPFNGYIIEWVEGIGDLGAGLFRYFADFEGYDQFVCARDASGDLWFDPAASDDLCDSFLCPLPKPGFDIAGQSSQTIDFQNLSRDADTWLWEFGDGTTSTEEHPQHVYSQPGCYDVCLTVGTSCLTQTRRYCRTVSVATERRWKLLPFITTDGLGLVSVAFPHPDTGWVLSSRHIWKTTDGGQSWTEQTIPPNPPGVTRTLLNIRMTNTQMGVIGAGNYVSGPGTSSLESNVIVTYDGGATWQDRNLGDHTFLLDAVLRTDGRGYTSGDYGEIGVSDDFGANWSYLPTVPWLHLGNLLYWQGDTIVANGHLGLAPQFEFAVARSFDKGVTWQVTELPDHTVNTPQSTFRTALDGWLPGNDGVLMHTTDAGQTWDEYDFGENRAANAIDFADLQHGWAVGEQGLILHTENNGLSWSRENCGYDENFTGVAAPSTDVAYAVTNQGLVLKYCEGPCASVIKSRETEVLSGAMRIYPNPATGFTRLLAPATGQLVFFDMLGRVGLQLPVPAGEQEIDLAGLSPGLWLLRLTTPGGGIFWEKLVVER